MAKWNINIKWVVADITNKSVYSPLFEWIVNWIQAIIKNNTSKWEIIIKVLRSNQLLWLDWSKESLWDIEWFEIIDDWIGFIIENQESFDTYRSDYKLEDFWWKWFWRFFYLKFFQEVKFVSIYLENWIKKKIEFDFDINAKDIMSNKDITNANDIENIGTKLILKRLKKQYITRLNSQSKHLDTLWRKLLEHLLMYFADDKFNCPNIYLDDWVDKPLLLNSLIWKWKEIEAIYNNKIIIPQKFDNNIKLEFWIKIFKIKYSTANNTINLCWHNRVVIEESLWKIIPDFNQTLKEKNNNKENNYSIKSYIFWDYLDKNVNTERWSFIFVKDEDFLKDFVNENDILNSWIIKIQEFYKDFLDEQKVIKIDKVKNFINKKAPWYSILYKNFDFNSIDSTISEERLDMKFHELKYKQEKETKIKVDTFVKSSDFSSEKEVLDLVNSLSDVVKTDLAHYVATRKFTLDLLYESLKWDDETKKYKSEDSVHTIIFPTKNDSEEISYEDHNLWILDEKLAFTNYVASDRPLNWGTTERPDIIIYDNPIALRWDNTASNPITIFEFKKPWRDDFTLPSTKKDEDPIEQIKRYRNNIIDWKYTTRDWLEIEIQPKTPFYWYVVCTLNKKGKNWLDREKILTMMPDWKWYFTWFPTLNMYVEVLDWSKVINDSKIRNQKFFERLKIN